MSVLCTPVGVLLAALIVVITKFESLQVCDLNFIGICTVIRFGGENFMMCQLVYMKLNKSNVITLGVLHVCNGVCTCVGTCTAGY